MENNLKKYKETIRFGHREILNIKEKFQKTTLLEHVGITGAFLTLFTLSFLSMSSLGMIIDTEESSKISLLPFYSLCVAGTLGIFGGKILKESSKVNNQVALIEADIKEAQDKLNSFHEDELRHSELKYNETGIEKEIG